MKTVKKFDARPKVVGTWKFLDDYSYENMIYGYLFYARFHRGKIKKIIFPSDFNISDFTIVRASDIPGTNIVPEPEPDQPFLASDEIFYFGQIIMGIAHPSKEILRDFVKNISVEFEELPAITDPKQCLDDEKNAFGHEITIDHTNQTKINENWIKTKSVYYTQHQEQLYLEPQAMIAIFNKKDLSMFVRGTMQCPFFVKEAVEAIMGDAVSKVTVETSEGIGGGFGGKEDFPNIIAGITALLSYKSGKPVKTVLERSDDIKITTKRHPSRIEIETYTDSVTKKIKKINIDYRLDTGFYQTLSPVVLSRGVLHAAGGYGIEDAFVRGRLLRSNTPPNGAFRGFGAPQAFFAIESHIDKIAAELKLDPYEFRKINIFKIGDEFPSSQKITETHLLDCLERVIEKSDYTKKVTEFSQYNKSHSDKKGIGISIGYHGGGYTGNGEKFLNSKVKIIIGNDGNINIFVANTDMGQGAHTTLAQIVSASLGHPIEKTKVILPNTDKTPNSGPTVASRTIYIIGNLLKKLSARIKNELKFDVLSDFIKENSDLFPKEYSIYFEPDPNVIFDENTYKGIGYKDYSWAACVAEIVYDPISYSVRPIKIWNVLDIGKPVNLQIAEGQVEGGVLQATGYALSEYFYKEGFGRFNGITDYVLPTTLDTPEIDVEFIHTDTTLHKGLGEIPMDYPAPAIRNAFFNATGIFIDELPLIPEKIFQHIKNKL
ncbi:MAG: hypothetical protein DRZ79_05065 [Candidatus Cloacimonadota bacterium]|nr:MAG: hypothetical protein DRZ79_05065 [Candidatus Cloacimonadota bacterium]